MTHPPRSSRAAARSWGVVALLLAGCTTSTSEVGAPTTSSAPSSVSGQQSASTSVPPDQFPLCPSISRSDYPALANCTRDALVAFWTSSAGVEVDRKVVFEPKYPPTPEECRTTQAVYAFYCSIDLTIYINTSQLRLWQTEFSAEQAPHALAMTLAHEFGHAVQNQLDEETVDEFGQRVELQADCLAGVWVGYAVRHDGLSQDSLLRAWRQETELLDTDDHRDTHGSVDQRLAATSKGIAGGSPTVCGLPDR